jgi:outer membrane protein assembly factor BamB
VGSQDYHLYCLNALSGELIWKYKTDGEVDSSPLIVGDRVYFGSYDGFLYALNATDKSEIWKFNTGSEIWGSPAFTEDSIYIGTKNGKMYSVWANNGTEHWNYSTNQFEELHGIYSTPVVTGDRVIFGSEDKFLYSLNASTGDRVWMFKTTGYIYSSAAVGSGKVYFTSLEEQKDAWRSRKMGYYMHYHLQILTRMVSSRPPRYYGSSILKISMAAHHPRSQSQLIKL